MSGYLSRTCTCLNYTKNFVSTLSVGVKLCGFEVVKFHHSFVKKEKISGSDVLEWAFWSSWPITNQTLTEKRYTVNHIDYLTLLWRTCIKGTYRFYLKNQKEGVVPTTSKYITTSFCLIISLWKTELPSKTTSLWIRFCTTKFVLHWCDRTISRNIYIQTHVYKWEFMRMWENPFCWTGSETMYKLMSFRRWRKLIVVWEVP